MCSGLIRCQKCGEDNQYAGWVNGVFKDFDKVICSKCGFLICDREHTYKQQEDLLVPQNTKEKEV